MRSIECTWSWVSTMFPCGDIGQKVSKIPKLFGKFPIDVPLPIFPMGNMPHVLHQKMRIDEIYRTHLVSSVHDVPMWRYRSKGAKMPKLFLGNFPSKCLCLSSQWAVCLMCYTKRCGLMRSIEWAWSQVSTMTLWEAIGKMPKTFPGNLPKV